MYGMTVHRTGERVNTLCRVTSEQTPGQRLKAYIRAHWTRQMGGDTALAQKAGVRRQTLQDWYSGATVPRLTELAEVAGAMSVRRVDLVAAYDGVDAPETQEAAAPSMTRRLLAGVIALERQADISPDELASAQELAAAIEAGMEADARIAAELEASRRKSSARTSGRGGGRSAGSQGNKRRTP